MHQAIMQKKCISLISTHKLGRDKINKIKTKEYTTKRINDAKMNEITNNKNVHVKVSKVVIQQEESI